MVDDIFSVPHGCYGHLFYCMQPLPLAIAIMYTPLSLRQCCVHRSLPVCIASVSKLSKFSRFYFIFVFKKERKKNLRDIAAAVQTFNAVSIKNNLWEE